CRGVHRFAIDRTLADIRRHHRLLTSRPVRLHWFACDECHAAVLGVEADRLADGASAALSFDGGDDDCAPTWSHGNPGGLDHETNHEAELRTGHGTRRPCGFSTASSRALPDLGANGSCDGD